VRFYFDLVLQAPLVLVLFGFFVLGAAFGVAALLTTMLRQRREISTLRKKFSAENPVPPPVPPL
jgi:uncharacterized integral membrane protein